MKYILDSDLERRRLELQAKLLDPYTRRSLQRAGVGDGKTVLDIGTGAGDVALLAAEMVGSSGKVVGVDIETGMVDHARSRAQAAGIEQAIFKVVSDSLDEIDETYDVVFSRLILLFQSDKVAMLRRAARLVRPGGTLAVIESSWTIPAFWSWPTIACYDRYADDLTATFSKLDIDNNVGSRMVGLFDEAGLAEPQMSAELLTGGKASGIVEYVLLTGQIVMEQAHAAAAFFPTLEEQALQRQEIVNAVQQAQSQFFGPCLVGASLDL